RTGRSLGWRPPVIGQNLHLVSRKGRVLFRSRTDEDAAVPAFIHGVVEFENEIAVLFSGAQPGAAPLRIRAPIPALAPDEHAVFDRPVSTIHRHPAGKIPAVEK